MKSKFMAISVLLFLVLMVAPVTAAPATKTLFTAEASFFPISPGKQWTTEDGILQVNGAIFEGTITGISGTFWIRVDETLDLNTGEGSLHGKWTITAMPDSYTFEGSVVGVITPTSPTTSHLSGTFIGHGTGDYEGQKMMGSFEGEVTTGGISNRSEYGGHNTIAKRRINITVEEDSIKASSFRIFLKS